jgi:hypothetical protein
MEIIKEILNNNTVNFIGKAEIFIKEIFYKIKERDMVSFFGVMVVFIKVNGIKVYKMVKGSYIYMDRIL